MTAYPLAKQGVFRTIQGEGALSGLPMVFVRLAGCSVGCSECDTDYAVASRADSRRLADLVSQHAYGGVEWVWVTGGEPLDHDLDALFEAVRGLDLGLKIALATAGTRKARLGLVWRGVDFLSVSPHSADSWAQRSGSQLNLVPGLNGLRLTDPSLIDAVSRCERDFNHRFVTPMADREGRLTNLAECLRWVNARPGWRLGHQSHKQWGMP